jgi:sugar (pentulose or hexulose) kinase
VAQAVAVIDIGKTRSKLTVWAGDGRLLLQSDYINAIGTGTPRQLDIAGIDSWLKGALAEAARVAEIGAIVPVGHGAAAVMLADGAPLAALDYEQPLPPDVAAAYEPLRDPFEFSLSPRLPAGLNLGAQLFWLERLHADAWGLGARLLLWPQYWAWRLSGAHASEVTSLGCHSDLWRPGQRRFSDLALARGWAERLGPLRRADDVAGEIRSELASELGLPKRCRVYVGLHDSNAALHAARTSPELAAGPFSVVSTGTWVVCMAAGGPGPKAYDPGEDMLANVDVEGAAIPTARFMGGRDYQAWMGDALGAGSDPALLGRADAASEGAAADPLLRATAAALRLARGTDRALALVGAVGPILVEGRFADDPAFMVALARLRPRQPVYRGGAADAVALGALRLAAPALAPPPLTRIEDRGE